MLIIKFLTDDLEIEGIKSLQNENLIGNISQEEAAREGFVTAVYSINFLMKMSNETPAVVAIDGNKVVAYALIVSKTLAIDHELLYKLVQDVDDNMKRQNRECKNYVIVGQLCVALGYRGAGVAQQLYSFAYQNLRSKYDCLVTEVANDNARSLKVHLKSGFQIFATSEYGGKVFSIVIWDWNI